MKNLKKYALFLIDDDVLVRFEIINRIAKGAYGIVWKAIEKKNREIVAIKKIFDAFNNKIDAKRTFREIFLLHSMGRHENVVKLVNVIESKRGRDIYLVFEYMDSDLHTVIRAGICEPIHTSFIMYQLGKALKFIHSAGVIHRDIKPSNILIN